MKENINITYDKKMAKNISEVTSISLENEYDIYKEKIIGNFIIEGSYKTHGLSLNQENISFNVPFEYNIKENVNKESLKVEVSDFTYTINADVLTVDISADIIYELEKEKEFDDIEEFDRFIKEHEVELINIDQPQLIPEVIKTTEKPPIDTIEPEPELIIEAPKETIIEPVEKNIILENVNEKEETYITYHVYICNENDTLETIAQQYKIDINLIKEYNSNIEITNGTKIIIPFTNE